MSGGQEKNFSTLGPKLSDSKALQYYGDKLLQICVQPVDYLCLSVFSYSRRQESVKEFRIFRHLIFVFFEVFTETCVAIRIA